MACQGKAIRDSGGSRGMQQSVLSPQPIFLDAPRCRYPPQGIRGHGPRRAGLYFNDADEYFRSANDAIIISPIIESREAIDNIDDIMSVDGIDAPVVGPNDLSISLGIFQEFDHPRYQAADRTGARGLSQVRQGHGWELPEPGACRRVHRQRRPVPSRHRRRSRSCR